MLTRRQMLISALTALAGGAVLVKKAEAEKIRALQSYLHTPETINPKGEDRPTRRLLHRTEPIYRIKSKTGLKSFI